MDTQKKQTPKITVELVQTLTLGEYAHQVIAEQYRNVLKQEKKVLADKDPEHLHDMRVATRRLRTALQLFDRAIDLPKAAKAKRVATLARTLGELRDLDVQMADLQDHYRPELPKTEQKLLDEAIADLRHQRRTVFSQVEETLTRSRYQALKTAYEDWIARPCFTRLASLRLQPLLPDLLSPLLAELLLHPGWLVPVTDASSAANASLHDLRKACKHARYQAEFFAGFYNGSFQNWIEEIKALQAKLGTVHDSQVLLELLDQHLPKHAKLPQLQKQIQKTQSETLADWEPIRQKYLDPDFRQHLHRMLLDAVLFGQNSQSHLPNGHASELERVE